MAVSPGVIITTCTKLSDLDYGLLSPKNTASLQRLENVAEDLANLAKYLLLRGLEQDMFRAQGR